MSQRSLKLVFEVFAPDRAATSPSAGWIASLNHKISNISMEDQCLVIALLGQLDKIPDCLGGKFGVQLNVELSMVRLYFCKTCGFDSAWLEHEFFVGQQGTFSRCVRCE